MTVWAEAHVQKLQLCIKKKKPNRELRNSIQHLEIDSRLYQRIPLVNSLTCALYLPPMENILKLTYIVIHYTCISIYAHPSFNVKGTTSQIQSL